MEQQWGHLGACHGAVIGAFGGIPLARIEEMRGNTWRKILANHC